MLQYHFSIFLNKALFWLYFKVSFGLFDLLFLALLIMGFVFSLLHSGVLVGIFLVFGYLGSRQCNCVKSGLHQREREREREMSTVYGRMR